MKFVRIIPKLDIKGRNLVKGINYEGLRVLGNPNKFSKLYYQIGSDEIIYNDLMASLHKRNTILETISETVRDVFIPITVGGGLRTITDISNVLESGADKVFINTAAIKNINFIKEAVNLFGSSTIVICIETANVEGDYYPFIENAREFVKKKTIDWISEVQDYGIGEIFLSSIDADGTGRGLDINLLDLTIKKINVPLIIHGGAGSIDDIANIIRDYDIDGVSISSLFHYSSLKLLTYENKDIAVGNTNFVDNYQNFNKFNIINLYDLKKQLSKKIKDKLIRY